MSDSSRAAVVARARGCLGTPFVWQGRQPGVGLDCIGLVLVAAANPALQALDEPDYSLSVSPERLRQVLDRAGLMPTARPQPGDLLLLTVRAQPLHLAIATPDGLIHADLRLRRVVEHALERSWQARLSGSYGLPGVT